MRLVLAGAAGFIGSHLCDRLLAENHTVIALDNLLTGSLDNIAHLAGHPRFRFVQQDVCEPVEIDGLKISSGDLLHGDCHGLLTIPLSIANQIPDEASKILGEERELIEYCRSRDFSLDGLSERIRTSSANCDLPWRSK